MQASDGPIASTRKLAHIRHTAAHTRHTASHSRHTCDPRQKEGVGRLGCEDRQEGLAWSAQRRVRPIPIQRKPYRAIWNVPGQIARSVLEIARIRAI